MKHHPLILRIGVPAIVMIGVVAACVRFAGPTEGPAVKRSLPIAGLIGGEELVKPTMVALDFQDRPMSEVIQVLSARTGCPLRIYEVGERTGSRRKSPFMSPPHCRSGRPSIGSARLATFSPT